MTSLENPTDRSPEHPLLCTCPDCLALSDVLTQKHLEKLVREPRYNDSTVYEYTYTGKDLEA